jgi:hypothetical protein
LLLLRPNLLALCPAIHLLLLRPNLLPLHLLSALIRPLLSGASVLFVAALTTALAFTLAVEVGSGCENHSRCRRTQNKLF